jgi:hypothetical protein
VHVLQTVFLQGVRDRVRGTSHLYQLSRQGREISSKREVTFCSASPGNCSSRRPHGRLARVLHDWTDADDPAFRTKPDLEAGLRSTGEPDAVELLEQAFESFKRHPLLTIAPHWIGSLPFLGLLLLFLFEMRRGAVAAESLLLRSLAVTLSWVWMNFWQAVYCSRLRAKLGDEPDEPWTGSRVLNTALVQTTLQSFKLVVLPAALLIGIPFAWTFTFFETSAAIAGTRGATLHTVRRRSRAAASMWQKQSWNLAGILTLLAVTVFINLGITAFAVYQLARSFIGITTPMLSRPDSFFNSTLIALTAAATYLCLDPVVKAAFVARCFAIESIHTGAGIRLSLRRIMQAGLTMLLLAASLPAAAQTRPIDSSEFDQVIDRVLSSPEYSWRNARHHERRSGDSMLDRAADTIVAGFQAIGRAVGRVFEWLLDFLIDREIEMPGGAVRSTAGRTVRNTLVALSVVLAVVLLAGVWRLRRRRSPKQLETVDSASFAAVDVSDETISAAQLEQEEWVRLADDLLAKGETRLALRAVFLGALARLQREGLIKLERFKTNLDYDRELGRRARTFPQVRQVFRAMMQKFEYCWYGSATIDERTVTEMRLLLMELRPNA